jgi:hypothetical protein
MGRSISEVRSSRGRVLAVSFGSVLAVRRTPYNNPPFYEHRIPPPLSMSRSQTGHV